MFWKRKPKVNGQIGYFGLDEWWLSTFTDAEREYIQQTYKPFSVGTDQPSGLTEGTISFTTQTPIGLLWPLAGWFKKAEDFSIAKRLLEKAEELSANSSPSDLHYFYTQKIEIFYRVRDIEPSALETAIQACEQQIEIASEVAKCMMEDYPEGSLPSHVGYKQLAIVYEKQKRYIDAVHLCQQAKEQGWNGDWDKRIERCKRKMNKTGDS